MSDLHVSWEEYRELTERLAVRIYTSGWDFDHVVCLARGGLRVGDVISRVFDRPLAILSVSSYGGGDGRSRGELRVAQTLSTTDGSFGGQVLVVDDLADSGATLARSVVWLRQRYGDRLLDLRTAVLWHKGGSTWVPDYCVEFLPDNPWIYQPFEEYERILPAELARKYG